MPNQEILTALKNAIEHGDSLESATQIMINSGYDANDVQEAAKFTSAGSINLQPEPEEELVMPEQKKSLTSKLKFWEKNKDKNKIPTPTESMRLSSESIKKQQIIPTQNQTLSPQVQQPQQVQVPPIQQAQQQAIQQPAIRQTKQMQQPVIQQQTRQIQQPITQQQAIQQQTLAQQVPIQQIPQQKSSILERIAKRAPRPAAPSLAPKQGELTKDLKKIKPKGTSHKKEIILVAILLILIGTLIATIIYRDVILSWFN